MSAPPQHDRPTISIDDDVALLSERLHELKRLGDNKEVSNSEVYNFSIQWGVALAGRLPRLVYYDARGLLSDTDAKRFHSLCDEFRAVSVIAARLGLASPALPFTTGTVTPS